MPNHTPYTALPTSFALATLFAVAACVGGGEPAERAPNETGETEVAPELSSAPSAPAGGAALGRGEASGAASTGAAGVARVCRELMQRERDCSDDFISALVAERVRLDLPSGIAARDAQLGREALVSEALDEYADDSSDERIASSCSGLAAQLPPERGQRLVEAGASCLALTGCSPFVACAVPISIQP